MVSSVQQHECILFMLEQALGCDCAAIFCHANCWLYDAGVFDCKPLAFIWAKFPNNYAEDNTIMFDDLRRNYVMNPQNGLVIHPYKHAHRNKDSDKELLYLAEYLQSIASMPSLSGLRHSRWQRYLEKLGTGQP